MLERGRFSQHRKKEAIDEYTGVRSIYHQQGESEAWH